MPRPGPRPYECVRRAWHSDRHQPIRGSLIQEIFRVVNEIHSSATKKNKEWQDKLPIVVLKAEEIMYSKANSEAEYMDLKTLWDRTNDAINTIIRQDESTETVGLLQPCIEAALNLGCTPRRASRSQRNSNLRCYLNANTPETTCVSHNSENTTEGNNTTNIQFMSHYSSFMKSSTMNSIHLGSESRCPITQNKTTNKSPFLSTNFPPHGTNQCLPMESYPSSNSCSIYPLYYGNSFQSQESQSGFGILSKSSSHPMESAEMGVLQNLLSHNVDASNKTPQAELGDSPENLTNIGYDLSLRLGPLSVPCINAETSWLQEVEDVGSSTSREGSKLSAILPQMDKEFSFFPKVNADDPLDSYSSKWNSEDKKMNVEATMRKRKAVFSHSSEDGDFCWQPKLSYNHLTGRMSNAGKKPIKKWKCFVGPPESSSITLAKVFTDGLSSVDSLYEIVYSRSVSLVKLESVKDSMLLVEIEVEMHNQNGGSKMNKGSFGTSQAIGILKKVGMKTEAESVEYRIESFSKVIRRGRIGVEDGWMDYFLATAGKEILMNFCCTHACLIMLSGS